MSLPRPPMRIGPVVLRARAARLEPLDESHAPGLLGAATPDTFEFLGLMPDPWDGAGFLAYVRALRADPARLAFAIIDAATGRVAGTTSYHDIRAKDHVLHIGTTWITPALRGTPVNPEIKFLMLRHAFETLRAERVALHVDFRNARSRAAVAKLGAVEEGVTRHNRLDRTGRPCNLVVYSFIPAEWPAARARLVERLGYEP